MRYPPFLIAPVLLAGGLLAGCRAPEPLQQAAPPPYTGWYAYGGDAGGTRFVRLDEITPENVGHLAVAWTYRTGELGEGSPSGHKLTFEATPIYFEGTLYLTTAFGEALALDPATGAARWTFDAGVDRSKHYSEVTSRGASIWQDAAAGAPCPVRLFLGTIDARLIALDARTGQPCTDFGNSGAVDLAAGYARDTASDYVDYEVTSPPVVVGDLVVVGSSIGDNWHVDTGRGTVRAFDVRTGAVRWQWDPIPYDSLGGRAGAANAWAPMAADPARDLLFVPTSSPSPDFFGGFRPGDNRHANAIVALRASTGEVVWSFQTVHHDLWDYDLAAQPALVEVMRGGTRVPAVAQATKMGLLFLLHRETGEPLFPVEERPVPASDVEGEQAASTQPFPTKPRPLMPHQALEPEAAWGLSAADREACRALIAAHRTGGIYTPPSLEGTITAPGNASGTNWGSTAYDPERQLLVLNTSRLVTLVQLILRPEYEKERSAAHEAGSPFEFGAQRGAPYAVKRLTLLSPSRMPCNPPPWGMLAAVHLGSGEVQWEVPLGEMEGEVIGLPNAGGPLITASGLVFIGAAMDNRFRAFDVDTGAQLWSAALPRSAIATPMSYEHDGKQYVVVAAGGHGKAGIPTGDYLIAYALP